jgi:hypothetical protein
MRLGGDLKLSAFVFWRGKPQGDAAGQGQQWGLNAANI